ncbi:MAG: GyrI-like domain-containing protein [Lysinibacillus sp.]
MTMTIENLPIYRIAYVRQVGAYGIHNVVTMEKIKEWAKSNDLITDDSIIFGIAQDNPQTTKPESCRYDACIVISKDYIISDGDVSEGNMTGGKYAVFKIDHTAQAVQKAWNDIFTILSSRGIQIDGTRPIIERYIVKLVSNHQCEICVPVY